MGPLGRRGHAPDVRLGMLLQTARGLVVLGAAFCLVAAGTARWALPPVAFPAPTGGFAVGTTTV